MAFHLRTSAVTYLTRSLFFVATVLYSFFRKPFFQWLAIGFLAAWLISMLVSFVNERRRSKPRQPKTRQATQEKLSEEETEKAEAQLSEDDLFLIRQVNSRITEQLKLTYPAVSWLWAHRPSGEQLRKGGIWRIRVSNADPFNFAEVVLKKTGRLSITMIQAVPVKDVSVDSEEATDDLADGELLHRVDVKGWYASTGEQILASIVDNLNSQGHHSVLVKDDGSVVIQQSGTEEPVEKVQGFPPRMVWDEFCQLLKEDNYQATVQPSGLLLAW